MLAFAQKTVCTAAPVQKGELRAFKAGGQWRCKRIDLDPWIE